MTKITTMNCFILAHIMAQNQLLQYFGGNGKLDEVDECEIARCILQSQISTYKALIAAADNQVKIGVDILFELTTLYTRKNITESLHHFVEKAHHDGAISATEAHAILHPLNHQISHCMKELAETTDGVVRKTASAAGTGNLEDRLAALSAAPAKDKLEPATGEGAGDNPANSALRP